MARGRKNALEAFLSVYVCGATVETAADRAGVSRTTASKWLQDPEVKKRLADLKADVLRRNADMLAAAGGESIKTLLDLQKSTSPPAVRQRAAQSVLELALQVRQAVDLEDRLLEVERKLQTKETK